MSIEPKDMVDYAHQMLSNDSPELELRNIINRAYYGAFLTARDAANITNSSGSVHKEVADYYLRQKSKSRLGNSLNVLKKLRETADYKPDEDVTPRDAKKSCRTAKSILDGLDD